MKKLFFLFACLSVMSLSAQAQKCAKSSKACTKMTSVSTSSVDDAVVAKAASLDEAIERKVCAKSGNVSYHMNYVCSDSGKMTSKPVSYDAVTAKFVNVSPSETAPVAGKKACCSSGSCKKACCAGKTKAATKSAAIEGKTKAIKVSSGTQK